VTEAHAAVEAVVRRSRDRLVAHLAAWCGDVAGAEDALADAVVAALRTWPEQGEPTNPEGWLVTTARRRILQSARHRAVVERAEPALRHAAEQREVGTDGSGIPDDRLRLLFVCAHPALDTRVHAPLMLQTVLGLDAARIASAFLVAPATMSQRLVRAKTKIRDAGIPFVVPRPDDLPGRLGAVLDAVYVAYGSGWDDIAGADPKLVGPADEAIRLARLVVEVLPDEPEASGLLALLLHSAARRHARRGDDGAFVPLSEQDTGRWSRPLIDEAETALLRAAAAQRPGRYQLEAAIQSVHAQRAITGTTDWAAVAALYGELVRLAPTVGAAVAWCAALTEASGPEAALRQLDELPSEAVAGYQPHWVVRAHLLRRLGRDAEAADARTIAVGLTKDPAVAAYLLRS
jgi:RNA polymerase sigma-70 factor (ECF subfamily)